MTNVHDFNKLNKLVVLSGGKADFDPKENVCARLHPAVLNPHSHPLILTVPFT